MCAWLEPSKFENLWNLLAFPGYVALLYGCPSNGDHSLCLHSVDRKKHILRKHPLLPTGLKGIEACSSSDIWMKSKCESMLQIEQTIKINSSWKRPETAKVRGLWLIFISAWVVKVRSCALEEVCGRSLYFRPFMYNSWPEEPAALRWVFIIMELLSHQTIWPVVLQLGTLSYSDMLRIFFDKSELVHWNMRYGTRINASSIGGSSASTVAGAITICICHHHYLQRMWGLKCLLKAKNSYYKADESWLDHKYSQRVARFSYNTPVRSVHFILQYHNTITLNYCGYHSRLRTHQNHQIVRMFWQHCSNSTHRLDGTGSGEHHTKLVLLGIRNDHLLCMCDRTYKLKFFARISGHPSCAFVLSQ